MQEEYDEGWYQKRIKNPNPTNDPRLNGYYERKPMHLLKLAMIIAASFRDETEIRSEDLQLAMELFDEVEGMMPKVFANVGKNPLSVDYDEVLSAIRRMGGDANFGELMKKFKHAVRKDELNEVLETLAETRQIVPGPNKTYKATEE